MKQLFILLFLISNLFAWDARSFASNIQKTFSNPIIIKPRIVGGYPVTQYQNASWVTLVVGYQDSDYHNQTTEPITKCTGTVFKDKWVLTAKHCLVDELGVKLNDTVEVWSNIYNLNNYQNLNITRGISYVYGDEDFAILRLENSTKTNYIKLATKDDKQYMLPGTSSLVFGWGTTNIYGTLESDKLLYTEVPIVDSWRCSNIIYGSQPYSKYLCTYHDTLYKGPCFGDSGGPLVILDENKEFIQVGVTSTVTGYGCGYEAAYTKVSEFSDTIISFANEVDMYLELSNNTHSIHWHFWQTPSGKAYLASDVHNVNKSSPAVWEFTNPDRKWKPIHNAAAFDGFEKRSLMYENVSFKNGYSKIYFGSIK